MRHFCASQLYGNGLDLLAIQEVLGHSWIATTMRYINPRELHQAGEKSQVARSRRGLEGLRGYYDLAV
ncbi:site-specific integrase [Streptomyces sp. NPDC051320]|uniref:site-specific integrase n=1 Tax=Streptomyces sp. NPDC051320 TaxID=3154644 RepID=UPI0034290C84